MNSKNRALSLLCHLPKEVCPKWRLSVAKAAWAEQCPGLVSALPALITNTGLASSLASEVIGIVLGRSENLEMIRRLASVSGDYVCSLARQANILLQTGSVHLYSTGTVQTVGRHLFYFPKKRPFFCKIFSLL